MRVLIHPTQDAKLLADVTAILEQAIATEPDTFDHVVGKAGVVDHYGYHTDMVAATVLSEESFSTYLRLTIRHGEHPVYDELMQAVISHYQS
jgi:hypothetical protein